LAGRADREPAEVAELGERDVGADLEAELGGIESEGLVLVVDPELRGGELVHGVPPGEKKWELTPGKLRSRLAVVFSKRAVLRAAVDAHDARGHDGPGGGGRKIGAIGGGRLAEHAR